jgi:hypothetical protein
MDMQKLALQRVAGLREENERLKERVAALQASSGYELSIAQVEIERLRTQCGGNCRYWEGRWRTEYAENQRLRTLLRRLVDIEGPQPGTKEWADDVCRALSPSHD